MRVELPPDWQAALAAELRAPYFAALSQFVDARRERGPVYPAEPDVFAAFRATPLSRVRAVLVGQDPYHGEGQAMGLCFSVPDGIKPPPSLRNILRELSDDLGGTAPESGSLASWAERGVLMLNTVLTVDAGAAGSHRKQGWEHFTDAAICAVVAREEPVGFVLWGAPAQAKKKLLAPHHPVVESPHPSPLSAHRGFFGSRPFSRLNAALEARGQPPIDFSLG